MISSQNKFKVVLSGVNINEAGHLKVFKEMINAFLKKDVHLICIVNDILLFKSYDNQKLEFIEFPEIKKSWFSRLKFEFFDVKKISIDIDADIWINMQDISANTVCKNSFVYCHNPSMFAKKSFSYLLYDWKFFLWNYLYKYLYQINISSNNAVIVQQEWIAKEFKSHFNIKNIIVARPKNSTKFFADDSNIKKLNFIYPSLPRVFKNFELILNAINYFNDNYPHYKNKISCTLTFDQFSNKFSKYLFNKYSHLQNVEFSGILPYSEVQKRLKNSTIGIFPSKLETWGLPINEYQENNLPIIVADLPYAHETVGDYNKVHFVDPDDYKYLAKIFKKIIDGDDIFYEASYKNENQLINSYDSLVNKIFELSK